jgi:hypothetical protein
VNTNNTAACDDGSACTTGDVCSGGACIGGPPIGCHDGNPCTTNSCDPLVGCVFTNNSIPCDDGNACTVGDQCGGGTCVGGSAAACDDGNVCTTDSCNPATGCVHTAVAGCCNTDADCADSDLCTTNERCVSHACGSDAVVCNDDNSCTDDSCNPALGCVHTNNALPCNDHDACTTGDTCSDGVCAGGTPLFCGDGNLCTNDGCNPTSGCTHVNNSLPCSDGRFCTVNDTCTNGSCIGAPRDCSAAGNQCRVGTCDEALDQCTGPQKPDGTPCSDGTACTTGETCTAGLCGGGTPIVCGACETCEPTVGCQIGPRPACHHPTVSLKGKLQIDDSDGELADSVSWKLTKGDLTSILDLRDPMTTTDFRFCVFDQGGAHLAIEADVPAGGTCVGRPCWKVLGAKGFKYVDPARASDGVLKLVISTSSTVGSMKAQLKAKGDNLPALPLPLAMPVVAELESAAGPCWKTRHESTWLLRNDARQFRALGD